MKVSRASRNDFTKVLMGEKAECRKSTDSEVLQTNLLILDEEEKPYNRKFARTRNDLLILRSRWGLFHFLLARRCLDILYLGSWSWAAQGWLLTQVHTCLNKNRASTPCVSCCIRASLGCRQSLPWHLLDEGFYFPILTCHLDLRTLRSASLG